MQQPNRLEDFFANSFKRAPENPCVIEEEGQTFSYRDIDKESNRLAHWLIDKGVKSTNRIAIMVGPGRPLYVIQLAILKAGAVYVPIDIGYPADRIRFICEDADCCLLLTTRDAAPNSLSGIEIASVDDLDLSGELDSPVEVDHDEGAICYICYTSGTTGKPKGVVISHANICNFISVATPCYGYSEKDRVYQGLSPAFDFSIEEIWTTLAVGGALVPRPAHVDKLGPGLREFLVRQQVTVLACVPTLLTTLDQDVPSLRILMVSGEACPQSLANRWTRPDLTILNTYGPTEASVSATYKKILPEATVTIGKPLPSYEIKILDEQLNFVPDGQSGEICIGGPGVAVGYLNRPELTDEKFVTLNPEDSTRSQRIYRTGDLGLINQEGEIEFLGRIDTQAKINGFRIELEEIEEELRSCERVNDAAVILRDKERNPQITAYVTLHSAEPTDDSGIIKRALFDHLTRVLPPFMIPSVIEIIPEMPMMVSGKVDRKALPEPESTSIELAPNDLPSTDSERLLAGIWENVFEREHIGKNQDFFDELRGHSLTVAMTVSSLRSVPGLEWISMADIYQYPTVALLASYLDDQRASNQDAIEIDRREKRYCYSSYKVFLCGLGQALFISLYLLAFFSPTALIIFAIDWDQPFLIESSLTTWNSSWWENLAATQFPNSDEWARLALEALHDFPNYWERLAQGGSLSPNWIFLLPGIMLFQSLALPVLVKTFFIGRLRPGIYPLWGITFLRWWAQRKTLLVTPTYLLSGTPFQIFYLNLLGAKISKKAYLATLDVESPDFIEIEDGVNIGYEATLAPYAFLDGRLHLGPIRIESGATIGARSVVGCDTIIGRDAVIGELTSIEKGARIPDGEHWQGSPRKKMSSPAHLFQDQAPTPIRWGIGHRLAFVIAIVTLFHIPFHAALLAIKVASGLIESLGSVGIALAVPASGLVFTTWVCLCILIIKRALPRLRLGAHAICSWSGLAKWLGDKLMETSLFFTNPLYSTMYTPPWLRLLGAKIGRRAEISTLSDIDPDFLTLGEECFLADLASIGPAIHSRGYFLLAETTLGKRSFVGNAALVTGNTRMGDNTLLGVQSTSSGCDLEDGTSWLGSPAIYLPRREIMEMDEGETYNPSLLTCISRLLIEFFRFTMPPGLLIVGTTLVLSVFESISANFDALSATLFYAMLLGLEVMALALIVAAFKWILIGVYRPRIEGHWSFFVRRTEFVTALYENVTVPLLLSWFSGTPFMAPILRIYGVHMGKRVYCETDFMTEFDLVDIGDDCIIGKDSSLQTHLFEDRIMKMSKVSLKARSSVGTRCVVLYDSVLAEGSRLDDLSLVMKRESIPNGTLWGGIPAHHCR